MIDRDSQVERFLAGCRAEADEISPPRKAVLHKIAAYVQESTRARVPTRLMFLCTQNSRRSQLAQVWAAAAAMHYGMTHVETYSGGTVATAFHPHALAALERAGLSIVQVAPGENPRYEIHPGKKGPPLLCFSKKYDAPPNPSRDFCAVMTCSQVEVQCPVVTGATVRLSLPYDDPKVADGTPRESQVYDQRCRQICREMLYLFSLVSEP